jgi:hypothetical protein
MKAGRDRWFFSGMAAAVIAIVAAGFAPTYYFRPIVAAPALPLPDAGTPFGLSSLRRPNSSSWSSALFATSTRYFARAAF